MSSAIVRGLITEELRAGEFSLIRATYPAGSRLRRHEHPVASLQIVVSGAFRDTVGQRKFPLASGSVVFKPAGVTHADAYDEFVECLVVEVPNGIGCELREVVAELTTRAWAANLLRESRTRLPGWELTVEGMVFQAL